MIQTTIAQWQNNPNHKKGFNEYTGLDKVRLEEDGSYCLYTRVEE